MEHEIPDGFELGGRRAPAGLQWEDLSGEEMLHKCCVDCGFNRAAALQALAWADAHLNAGTRCAEIPGLLENCCHQCGLKMDAATTFLLWYAETVLPEASPAGIRKPDPAAGGSDGSGRLMGNLFRIFKYLKLHPGPICTYAALHVFDVPLLDSINGDLTPAQFANTIINPNTGKPISREAVNKEVKAALKYFGLKPRKGMREESACAHMTAARLKQLKRQN